MATRYIDPVCGLEITEENVGASLEYDERMVYFCSVERRDIFMEEPLRYLENQDEEYRR
ncbi:MAG: YHS domain-containing protein [Chloroflexota bacterium]